MSSVEQEKIVVYTAIFDDYDVLIDPEIKPENVDFVCFTDNEAITSDVWEMRYIGESDSPRLINRKLKFHPHRFFQEYSYSVYVDGNIQILGDITDLVEKYLNSNNLAVPRYPYNNCIYDEYPHAHRVYEENEHNEIENQLERYKKEGLPENFGLPENNIIIRRHDIREVIELMEEWWKEYQKGSNRDQVSFPFIAWKNNFEFTYIDEGPRTSSSYFRLHPHRPPGMKPIFWRAYICVSANRDSNLLLFFCWIVARSLHVLQTEGLNSLIQRSCSYIRKEINT